MKNLLTFVALVFSVGIPAKSFTLNTASQSHGFYVLTDAEHKAVTEGSNFEQMENTNEEIWIGVFEWEDKYQVSSKGRIKRLRYITTPNTTKIRSYTSELKEKILRPGIDGSGYYRMYLIRNGKLSHSEALHRLVAAAFIPNPDNKPEVNHKDGDKLNNRIENLEWVTSSENQKHSYQTGLRKPMKLQNHPMWRNYNNNSRCRKVLQYSKEMILIREFESISDASRFLNRKRSDSVRDCCAGKTTTAYGFIWKYKSEIKS